MNKFGDNCYRCLCSKCNEWEKCGETNGDTASYCEEDCLGEGRYKSKCSEFRTKVENELK